MTYLEMIKAASKYQEIYTQLQMTGFPENLRKETAKRMGMSVPNADRYGAFGRLLPLVQTLARDCDAGMSSLLTLGGHSHTAQRALYDILINAWNDGFSLKRDFIRLVVSEFDEGKESWDKIKPSCSQFRAKQRKVPARRKRSVDTGSLEEVKNMSGTDFELWFAALLEKMNYINVETTQHSHDTGVDVIAQKDGVRYIFQCKNTATVGIDALQEIWFAKSNIDHVAVVVTSGTVSTSTRKLADGRGILCWDRDVLLQVIDAESPG